MPRSRKRPAAAGKDRARRRAAQHETAVAAAWLQERLNAWRAPDGTILPPPRAMGTCRWPGRHPQPVLPPLRRGPGGSLPQPRLCLRGVLGPTSPRRAGPTSPAPTSPGPQPGGARTRCYLPGRARLLGAKGPAGWGQNFFANDLGGAERSYSGGARTSSQNHTPAGRPPSTPSGSPWRCGPRGRDDVAALCGGLAKRGQACPEEPLPDDVYCRAHRAKASRGLPV